jgi:hypothetical protein
MVILPVTEAGLACIAGGIALQPPARPQPPALGADLPEASSVWGPDKFPLALP